MSPDLPYLSIDKDGREWCDALHYPENNSHTKTNILVISGFEVLRQVWPQRTPADKIKCAWLIGYYSEHLTDVGDYAGNEEAHRICEMTMDSLIFEEINHTDLTYAEFSEALKFCRESEHFRELLGFWQAQLSANYPAMAHGPAPYTWFEGYTAAIDTAEGGWLADRLRRLDLGGGMMAAIFRHAGLDGKYLYLSPDKIRSDYSEDYRRYYTEVKFPGGSGPFRPNGFDRAVSNVVQVWKKLYDGLASPGGQELGPRYWRRPGGRRNDFLAYRGMII